MRWLPPLPAPWQSVRLPLTDASAAVLCELLLQEDSTAPRQRLASAMRLDPALVLWTVFRCTPADDLPSSCEQLAGELQRQLPCCLEWPEDQPSVPSAASAKHFADLASDSVATASQAADEAAPHGSPARAQAYLLGLLASAPRWLKACGGGELPATQLLPPWLQLNQPAATGSTTALERARQSVLHALSQPTADRPPDGEVHRWWTTHLPLVCLLPELVRRLAALQELEQNFTARLENAKLQALYTLAAGAGHEINNPLGSIAGRAQLLLRDEHDSERRRTLAKINTQAFRAHEMISDMMLFAKPPQPVCEPVDLAKLARQVFDSLHELAGQRNIVLDCQAPQQPITLNADPDQISVALRAMCLNSIEALGGGGRVEIRMERVRQGPSRGVEITLRDDGPGMSPQQREHIFDPFYSGREAGRGLGFGLSKTWRIVQNHGGRIDVQSDPGQGATFRIFLPAA